MDQPRPSPADPRSDAAGTLADLDAIGRRADRAYRAPVTGAPLVGWGIAWAVGYPALGHLDLPWALVVGALATAVGLVATFAGREPGVSNPGAGRLRGAWFLVLAASPFLVQVVSPLEPWRLALFLGALWGVAMAIYAIMTADRALLAVSGGSVVLAAVVTVPEGISPLLVYGLGTGIALLVLGIVRATPVRSGR
ncbi:hypothetical protein [Occultella gossypii]|uniref:Uncharacterized protein n=1 Tax=Occultella gossypii TaxID=2800820 RepID=A0ABS7SBK2_9MICO|nr:hypothetical protein [Occultella gossypii]MBZ2196643.1 hypothetical protein [Occultella gossypii]